MPQYKQGIMNALLFAACAGGQVVAARQVRVALLLSCCVTGI